MRNQALLITTLVAVFSGQVIAEEKLAVITGYAYDRQTGDLIYTENHRVLLLEGDQILEHKTLYKDAQDKVICSKQLDYSDHRFAPGFELQDFRDGYMEGGEHTADGYRLYSREMTGADIKSKLVPVTENLVSDSGFDLYVRARMDALLKAKKQKFKMAVASEQAVLSFEAELVEKQQLFERPAIRIKIQPTTLLRLLVAPIYITYDIENGELLRYEGLSNIRNAKGNRHDVRIDFPPDKQQYAGLRRR